MFPSEDLVKELKEVGDDLKTYVKFGLIPDGSALQQTLIRQNEALINYFSRKADAFTPRILSDEPDTVSSNPNDGE